MSSSSSSLSYDNRINEFSYNALSLIATYACSTPQEAILHFSLINKRCNDVIRTQCRDMWRSLYRQQFPQLRTRPRDTYPSFATLMSRQSLRTRAQFDVLSKAENTNNNRRLPPRRNNNEQPPPMFDIENCVNETQDGDDEQVDFSFTCPVLAQNLTLLANEKTEDGLPILFCDICRKKVYTIDGSKSDENLKEAAKLGRCVSLSQEDANHLRMSGFQRVNVAIVVGNDEEEKLVHDMFRRMNYVTDTPLREDYFHSLATKNAVRFHITLTEPKPWTICIIKKSCNNDQWAKEDGTDEFGGPFSAKNAPEKGGWNFLILLDSVPEFKTKAASGTQLRALQDSGRVYKYDGKEEGCSNNDERIPDDDNTNSDSSDDKKDRSTSKPPSFQMKSDQLPESNFKAFWDFMEKQIVNEYVRPKHVKGKMRMYRRVRMDGPTRVQEPQTLPAERLVGATSNTSLFGKGGPPPPPPRSSEVKSQKSDDCVIS